jgi:hypothetical protein
MERLYEDSRTIFIVTADFLLFLVAVTTTLGIGYLRDLLS